MSLLTMFTYSLIELSFINKLSKGLITKSCLTQCQLKIYLLKGHVIFSRIEEYFLPLGAKDTPLPLISEIFRTSRTLLQMTSCP